MSTLDHIPVDLVENILKRMPHEDRARVACASKELKSAIAQDGTVDLLYKLTTIFRESILEQQNLPAVSITFHNRQGYVLFKVFKNPFTDSIYYKLDGHERTPNFDLTEESTPLFFNFVKRELPSVKGFDIWAYMRPRTHQQRLALHNLEKRLSSLF